jgi:hypothetical protein
MGIDFIDSEDVTQPPELVRFKNVQVKNYPDGRRVKIRLGVTAFQQAPNIEIEVYNPGGDRVASTSIVELGSVNMEVTLHLRGEIVPGRYLCKLDLGYRNLSVIDSREVAFSIFEADNQDQG